MKLTRNLHQNQAHEYTGLTFVINNNILFRALTNKLTADLPRVVDASEPVLDWAIPLEIPSSTGTVPHLQKIVSPLSPQNLGACVTNNSLSIQNGPKPRLSSTLACYSRDSLPSSR